MTSKVRKPTMEISKLMNRGIKQRFGVGRAGQREVVPRIVLNIKISIPPDLGMKRKVQFFITL